MEMSKVTTSIDEVISVCSAKDLDVWTVASKNIVQFIPAARYTVIVPDSQVDLFASVTCAPYQVKPESSFVGNIKERIAQTLSAENQDRVGWYLQQFVKISAILAHDDQDIVLIWDADTVPLKSLEFIDQNGRLIYYKGSEFRKSYFEFIERALGLKRNQDFSFIAQSLVAKVVWVRELFQFLESKTQKPWPEAVLAFLDPKEPAGFAEFETLGTWFWQNHRSEMVISDRPWQRNGLSLVGNPLKLSKSTWLGLSKAFDFVSFELWDEVVGLRKRFKRLCRRWKYACQGMRNS
jgi:hypothetical protein